MKELLYKKTVLHENGESFALSYYITIEKSDIDTNSLVYGVGIEKYLLNKKEISTVNDICISRNEIIEIIELLCYNTVTPTTLKDIILDRINA